MGWIAEFFGVKPKTLNDFMVRAVEKGCDNVYAKIVHRTEPLFTTDPLDHHTYGIELLAHRPDISFFSPTVSYEQITESYIEEHVDPIRSNPQAKQHALEELLSITQVLEEEGFAVSFELDAYPVYTKPAQDIDEKQI